MLIACSTSAFKIPLADAVAEIARLNFEAVDLIAIKAWGHVNAASVADDYEGQATAIETLLAKHHLRCAAINLAVAHPHQRADADVNAQRLREVDAMTRLARRLDAQAVSFYPGYKTAGRPWDALLADTVATVKEMLAAARPSGIPLLIEPHYDTPFQTPDQIRPLLQALPDLRIAYDPSHLAMQQIPLPQTEFLLDRAAHVHLRDAAPGKMCERFGQGTVDFDWLLGALRERAYAGAVSIEYLPKADGDPRPDIIALRDRLLKA